MWGLLMIKREDNRFILTDNMIFDKVLKKIYLRNLNTSYNNPNKVIDDE